MMAQKREAIEVPPIENWLVASMLALKMMYYIYIYLQGKVFMVYYFF